MRTVQQVFAEYGDSYRVTHGMSSRQQKVFDHILKCRTEEYGFHADVCSECGYERIMYNSCKDRHCPQCQTFKKEEWINGRKAQIIGTKYFHVVYTLPKELDVIAMQNQSEIYNMMFKASAETLTELCADKKYLGAYPGFISVLHTWGQTLEYHPHLHIIITGGGLDGCNRWRSTGEDFFIPVKVLSALFRGKFMHYLTEAYSAGKLEFYGSSELYKEPGCFHDLKEKLYSINWYSYVKRPFNGPSSVIEYLGRYTHRVAISNNRIVNANSGTVSFRWKDYRDESKMKVMTLKAHEFIRRFLLHVLPAGFVKIRYYGVHANRNFKTKLKLCRKLTGTLNNPIYRKLTKIELLIKVTKGKAFLCPSCNNNALGLFSWSLFKNANTT